MLNENDRIAAICQKLQNLQQFFDIGKMQSRRRFVDDVNRVARRLFNQFRCQFDSLRLSARIRPKK